MEDISSDILHQVLAESAKYSPEDFTPDDVRATIEKQNRSQRDFAALLSPAAAELLESMAEKAKVETAQYFGNGIRLFTPLYLANYCVNQCVYCAFNGKNKILRGKLTRDEILRELTAIAATGLDEVLLLTGESRAKSDVEYIGKAVALAAGIFSTVGLEIYPLDTDEYAYLREKGADFVSVYQETYDTALYERVHPAGPKRCFPYRFNAQERAILGRMRGVSFGALLGLGNFRRDAFAAGLHAWLLQQKYPHAEVSFSVPRLRSFENHPEGGSHGVGERELLQVMLALRLFMPFAGITISTRERPGFRDNVLGLCATKISAGVSVGVGGHESEQKGSEQFEISDSRSVDEIHRVIQSRGLQPVYTDYIRV
ncbi:MAG: 2-iminoacetate synthase ThiH [Oscillospiraceae bacterium]|nr:2-iminoacetate synthase ThiH [Oscillospiraceae bacterium]